MKEYQYSETDILNHLCFKIREEIEEQEKDIIAADAALQDYLLGFDNYAGRKLNAEYIRRTLEELYTTFVDIPTLEAAEAFLIREQNDLTEAILNTKLNQSSSNPLTRARELMVFNAIQDLRIILKRFLNTLNYRKKFLIK